VSRRTLQISPFASDDIVHIIEYLVETAGSQVAIATDARIDAAIASLEHFAERELVIAPYRIVYRVLQTEVWVVLVFDRRREPTELLASRLRDRR
jgi:toxin ParE1/3/4